MFTLLYSLIFIDVMWILWTENVRVKQSLTPKIEEPSVCVLSVEAKTAKWPGKCLLIDNYFQLGVGLNLQLFPSTSHII